MQKNYGSIESYFANGLGIDAAGQRVPLRNTAETGS